MASLSERHVELCGVSIGALLAIIVALGPLEPILEEADAMRAPVVQVRDSEAAALLREDALALSLHAAAPIREEFPLRNVAAILRGSDPVLQDQYVVLTRALRSHRAEFHRHFSRRERQRQRHGIGNRDRKALAALNPHPKRSILFMTFFGEEKGLLGSYYYTHHPLVPLKNTVANVNLEQMGRTDDLTGRKVGTFVFTGPSYSDLPAIISRVAKLEGVSTEKRPDLDDYFDRSDNYAFAKEGVVAHTIAVAVEFPGYHGLGDTLDKIDYDNMAKVDEEWPRESWNSPMSRRRRSGAIRRRRRYTATAAGQQISCTVLLGGFSVRSAEGVMRSALRYGRRASGITTLPSRC